MRVFTMGENQAEGRRRKAEGGRQKAEGRRRKAEGRRQKAEGRRQKAEGRRQKAEGGSVLVADFWFFRANDERRDFFCLMPYAFCLSDSSTNDEKECIACRLNK
jgi:hypothetical protein